LDETRRLARVRMSPRSAERQPGAHQAEQSIPAGTFRRAHPGDVARREVARRSEVALPLASLCRLELVVLGGDDGVGHVIGAQPEGRGHRPTIQPGAERKQGPSGPRQSGKSGPERPPAEREVRARAAPGRAGSQGPSGLRQRRVRVARVTYTLTGLDGKVAVV